MPLARRVQLFYDVLSPYSWLGFEILCRYRSKWNIKLELCPYYLAGIMGGSSNRPPGMVPAKGVYNSIDVMRLAKYFQIPLKQISDPGNVLFNKGSLKAQRFLIATENTYPEKLEEVSRQLWMRIWSRDEDITEESSLQEAGKKAGFTQEQVERVLGMIATPEVKERLKERTREALDLGCFGAPFIVVHMEDRKKETFFGSDRFELMAFVLGEKWEGPLTHLKARL